jgi:hypothetical protein
MSMSWTRRPSHKNSKSLPNLKKKPIAMRTRTRSYRKKKSYCKKRKMKTSQIESYRTSRTTTGSLMKSLKRMSWRMRTRSYCMSLNSKTMSLSMRMSLKKNYSKKRKS